MLQEPWWRILSAQASFGGAAGPKWGVPQNADSPGGAWVSQSVKGPTLDFGSGHDLTVCESEPHFGLCADSGVPAWDSPPLSFSLPLPHSCCLFLKTKKLKKNNKH